MHKMHLNHCFVKIHLNDKMLDISSLTSASYLFNIHHVRRKTSRTLSTVTRRQFY